jgi:putative membrane protein
MQKLLSSVITATLGLWLASMFVPGVDVALRGDSNFFGFSLTQLWQLFVVLGVTLGLINFYIKPVLSALTLPLKIITLGMFGLIIELGLIFGVDYLFREFTAPLIYPLLWTAVIIWALNIIVGNLIHNNQD